MSGMEGRQTGEVRFSFVAPPRLSPLLGLIQRALLLAVSRVVATLNNDRTNRRSDFGTAGTDIVKNGTPDQRAILRARNLGLSG